MTESACTARHLVEFVVQVVVLFLQTAVLTLQSVILYSGIRNFIAKNSVTQNEHKDDKGHKTRDDDDCQCIHIRFVF